MKSLKEYINESIFDIDDHINEFDRTLAVEEIKTFIDKNYSLKSYDISKKPNNKGKYIVDCRYHVKVLNRDMDKLTNDLFIWGKVGGDFSCNECNSLTTLEGAPQEVGRDFDCSDCNSLKTLDGSPKKVKGYFFCSYCRSLQSLQGIPKEIGEDFECFDSGKQFTRTDVEKLSKIKGRILLE
jgi:hypothetical protein